MCVYAEVIFKYMYKIIYATQFNCPQLFFPETMTRLDILLKYF